MSIEIKKGSLPTVLFQNDQYLKSLVDIERRMDMFNIK